MFVPWHYFGILAVSVRGVGDLNSILGGEKGKQTESQCLAWHLLIVLLLLINFGFFQQLPKEMLLFPGACSASEYG